MNEFLEMMKIKARKEGVNSYTLWLEHDGSGCVKEDMNDIYEDPALEFSNIDELINWLKE